MLETSNLLWARNYRLIKEIYRNQVNSFIESESFSHALKYMLFKTSIWAGYRFSVKIAGR